LLLLLKEKSQVMRIARFHFPTLFFIYLFIIN